MASNQVLMVWKAIPDRVKRRRTTLPDRVKLHRRRRPLLPRLAPAACSIVSPTATTPLRPIPNTLILPRLALASGSAVPPGQPPSSPAADSPNPDAPPLSSPSTGGHRVDFTLSTTPSFRGRIFQGNKVIARASATRRLLSPPSTVRSSQDEAPARGAEGRFGGGDLEEGSPARLRRLMTAAVEEADGGRNHGDRRG
jgi:hypothetical protein